MAATRKLDFSSDKRLQIHGHRPVVKKWLHKESQWAYEGLTSVDEIKRVMEEEQNLRVRMAHWPPEIPAGFFDVSALEQIDFFVNGRLIEDPRNHFIG